MEGLGSEMRAVEITVQVAPFWHGLEAHSFLSLAQFVPSHPGRQVQV